MRSRFVRPVIAVLALAGLAGCSGTPAPGGSSSASSAPSSSVSSSASSPSAAPSKPTPTQVPTTLGPEDTTPNPSLPGVTPTPGQGNAELSITVLESADAAPQHYTLVCIDGAPAAESKHPTADAACTALKNNPSLLSQAPVKSDQECTQQFGGPQTAKVTGAVDGMEISASFSRTDGCQIALWDAASAIIGSSGGAA
ncbi:SSI family serine proteinase inhibitor [Paenarthrobacter aromaticivorans]|uniref:SSI family serine proteinase inhibitor n=1 Tax=Paenarthrobacter aromaticivorans TaxID=2849150 RepID=UPI003A810E5E